MIQEYFVVFASPVLFVLIYFWLEPVELELVFALIEFVGVHFVVVVAVVAVFAVAVVVVVVAVVVTVVTFVAVD